MTELLTSAQMRAIETATIESGQVTGLELMERAGRGVVDAVFEEWPELAQAPHKAVVLCGPGNNGGDGFVVARLLKEWGWEVDVFLYGDADKLPPDAKANCVRWAEMGDVFAHYDMAERHADKETGTRWFIDNCDVFFDALFGTGLARPIEDPDLYDFFTDLNYGITHAKLVAVDIASGLCADSGRLLCPDSGAAAMAEHAKAYDLTVTFQTPKCGHYLAEGATISGRLRIADIGLAKALREFWYTLLTDEFSDDEATAAQAALLAKRVYLTGTDAMLRKCASGHKFSHGHALALTGGAGRTGAARLAARGALRIGAGLVTLGVPGAAQMEVSSQITTVMLNRIEDGDALTEVLDDARINALCLGPGLGTGKREKALILAALDAGRPTVLDADALSSAYFDEGDALFGKLHDTCVLTPHAGEFARLFPDIAEKLNALASAGPAYSKVEATREAAARAGCVVLFKGADTVIAAPDGSCAINSAHYDRAAPWLATAGSGDVLAGFISGLLARGMSPMQAAETAAWLHVECARSFGPGLIAEDLPEELPKVLRALEL